MLGKWSDSSAKVERGIKQQGSRSSFADSGACRGCLWDFYEAWSGSLGDMLHSVGYLTALGMSCCGIVYRKHIEKINSQSLSVFFGWWKITSVNITGDRFSPEMTELSIMSPEAAIRIHTISLSHNLWQCKKVNCSAIKLQYNYFTKKWPYIPHLSNISKLSLKSQIRQNILVPWKCHKTSTTKI